MLTWVTIKGITPSPKAYGVEHVTASKFNLFIYIYIKYNTTVYVIDIAWPNIIKR